MEENIKYRIAKKEDYPAILVLYNKKYKSNRSLDDFKWLIEDNPAGIATLFIATKADKAVGMQSLVPYLFIQNGELVKTYKSEDRLVDENLRGKGIFSKLYEMVHEFAGETLVWGLTDKNEILKRVGLPSSERLTIAVSVKRPSLKYSRNGFQRFFAKTLFYSFLYLKSSFRTQSTSAKFLLKEVNSSNYGMEDLQEFFNKVSTGNPKILYPYMDSNYLEWRLIKNPNLEKYQIYVSFNVKGEIAICSIIGFQGKSAYWQSYYTGPDVSVEEKIGHIVLLKEKIFKSGINLIHSWLFECNDQVKEVKHYFYQSGFSKVRDGLWIVHNSTEKEIDVHNLYFSLQLGIR